ncbi:MAG: glycosyltransferase family 4 protein [Planctomycetaceae bacterium]
MKVDLEGEQPLRILAISAEVPAAVGSGGAVRAWHCLRAVARRHRVMLHLLAGDVPGDLAGQLKLAGSLPAAGRQQTTRSGYGRFLQSLLLPWRYQGRALIQAGHNICVERSSGRLTVLHWFYGWWLVLQLCVLRRLFRLDPPDLHMRSGAVLPLEQTPDLHNFAADAVWIEHSYLYPLAERVCRQLSIQRILVNAHNVEHQLKHLSALAAPTLLSRCWQLQVAALCRQYETRMLRTAELIVCCSHNDCQRFRGLLPGTQPGARLAVAPNGVDTRYFQPGSPVADADCLIFTGTAGYGPNDDAVVWLLREVLPAIRRQVPAVRLILAGRNAGHLWGSLVAGVSGVELHSDVVDMRPLLSRARAAIVPLRQGSGTRFKILEAMSMGLPVISTSLGAEGLDVVDGRELLLANSSTEFAAATGLIWHSSEVCRQMASAARAAVCERYDWLGIESELELTLNGIHRSA